MDELGFTHVANGHAAAQEPVRGKVETSGTLWAKEKEQPLRLTKEEELTLELYTLKAQNLVLQRERLAQDFAASARMLLDLQKETKAYQESLETKYGRSLGSPLGAGQ